MADAPASLTDRISWIGLAAGPLLALVTFLSLPQAGLDAAGNPTGLSPDARATAAVGVLMAVWWLSEAIPLSATALLPLVLLPLTGAATASQAATPYANSVIFLFMGGFILGLGMEKWGLHRRIALITVLVVGATPKRLIAGFMAAAAVLSMWVSNTATAIMMLPIASSVVALIASRTTGSEPHPGVPQREDPALQGFATALFLAIAYACSIGGIGTLIGTPPNTILAAFVRDHLGAEISMQRWLFLSLPLVGVMLPLVWAYLVFFATPVRLPAIPGGRKLISGELASLGKMKRAEWIVFTVFCCAVLLWIFRPTLVAFGVARGITPLAMLDDTAIAIGAAISLFLIPVYPRQRIFAMDWATAEKLPWGVLILFGGGLSLAAAISNTGLDAFLGRQFEALEGVPVWLMIACITAAVIFLTELTSNTAVTNALMPVLAGAAPALGVDPLKLLVPAAIAASMAFMLPVATPPNAIVFGTGRVPLQRMARTGFGLNILGVVVVTLATVLLGDFIVGLAPSE